jgi:WhiB family redox-sensing transcriptional regulator
MRDTVNGRPLIQSGTDVHWMDRMLAEEPWRQEALCAQTDPDLFFEISGDDWRNKDYAEAKKICAACPVAGECLAWALRTNEQWGVAGGLTVNERRALQRRKN